MDAYGPQQDDDQGGDADILESVRVEETPDAVSYTHLDVYKRQGRGPDGPAGRGGSLFPPGDGRTDSPLRAKRSAHGVPPAGRVFPAPGEAGRN